MQALVLLNQGKLDEALSSAKEAVRDQPDNLAAREILIELMCLVGEFERADKQAEAILVQQPDLAVAVSLVRQLIRGELARRECWQQGRVPEFIGDVDEFSQLALKALVAYRSGNASEAAAFVDELDEKRPAVGGAFQSQTFDDFRDLDDLCLAHLEVVTSTGKYFWVPFHRVEEMTFEPVSRPRDLFWRQCRLKVESGPDGVVYVPAIYAHTDLQLDSPQRLGHATEWIGDDTGPILGKGQRIFLLGENEFPIMELDHVTFATG
ncbi:MAG: SciE type virulence protein [bacterium]|nr:SciE type virulence protein [bacterium]